MAKPPRAPTPLPLEAAPERSPAPPARRAQDFAAVGDWPGYFGVVEGKPPRETLLEALDRFDRERLPQAERLAIDLGCGEGRDTVELLRRGWRVLAVDSTPEAFARLERKIDPTQLARLTMRQEPMESFAPPGEMMLVNASFTLPFCEPGAFAGLWARLTGCLKPGGRFAGQLFGDRDDWASMPGRTHHSRSAVGTLLVGFAIERLDEEEKQEGPEVEAPKHWHIFHIVARKPPT